MPVCRIDHVNIRTLRFDETVRFYTEVLGLRSGPRAGGGRGAWIYDASGAAVVHLSFVDPEDAEQIAYLDEYLGARNLADLHGGGAIDHVAFTAEGLAEFRSRLQGLGVSFRERRTVADVDQIFLEDPNGVSIELNFHPTGR